MSVCSTKQVTFYHAQTHATGTIPQPNWIIMTAMQLMKEGIIIHRVLGNYGTVRKQLGDT